MHTLRVLCSLMALVCGTALAGAREDAFQVVQRWAQAFTAADVDAIVGLYADDAVFMGTVSKTIVTRPQDIRTYFEVALLGKRRFVASLVDSTVTAASDSAFVITALDKLVATEDGKTQDLFGRVTFVVARRGAGWQIVHFHRSALPA